jgi:hypothetical protein
MSISLYTYFDVALITALVPYSCMKKYATVNQVKNGRKIIAVDVKNDPKNDGGAHPLHVLSLGSLSVLAQQGAYDHIAIVATIITIIVAIQNIGLDMVNPIDATTLPPVPND